MVQSSRSECHLLWVSAVCISFSTLFDEPHQLSHPDPTPLSNTFVVVIEALVFMPHLSNAVMYLSIVCPTTPCTGRSGGIQGILLDLTLKMRPRGGAVDTPICCH